MWSVVQQATRFGAKETVRRAAGKLILPDVDTGDDGEYCDWHRYATGAESDNVDGRNKHNIIFSAKCCTLNHASLVLARMRFMTRSRLISPALPLPATNVICSSTGDLIE